MKVLHVLPTLSSHAGGPTEVTLNLVKALNDRGLDVDIATTNDNSFECLDVPIGERYFYQDAPVWFFKRTTRLKEFLISRSLAQWLWHNIHQYDILDLHYLFSFAPTVAAAIARHRHVPYTIRTMGQLSTWALAQSRLRKRLYSHFIERNNLNCAAAIHCTTVSEAQDVTNFGINTPKLVLPLGVSPTELLPYAAKDLRQTYQIPNDRLVILFLSRLHYKKQPDLPPEHFSQGLKSAIEVALANKV